MTLPTKCPPLIAENIGKHDDLGHVIDLERVAAAVIDSGWHYSWHWDRDEKRPWRPLSLKGWGQALTDGHSLLAAVEAKAKRLRDVLPLIEAKAEALDRAEREDEL